MFILISERLSASKDVCTFSHILLPHFRKDFCIYIAARTLYCTVQDLLTEMDYGFSRSDG